MEQEVCCVNVNIQSGAYTGFMHMVFPLGPLNLEILNSVKLQSLFENGPGTLTVNTKNQYVKSLDRVTPFSLGEDHNVASSKM